MILRIAEYKQIDTRHEEITTIVDDFNEQGEIIGQHSETVTKAIPVMGMIYRDETAEEAAERERAQREMEEAEANREPTVEEQLSDLLDLVSVLTEVICDD